MRRIIADNLTILPHQNWTRSSLMSIQCDTSQITQEYLKDYFFEQDTQDILSVQRL